MQEDDEAEDEAGPEGEADHPASDSHSESSTEEASTGDGDEEEDSPSEEEAGGDGEVGAPGMGRSQTIHHPSSRHSSAPAPEPDDTISSLLRQTREEDRRKGKAVSRQIVRFRISANVRSPEWGLFKVNLGLFA